MALGFGFNKAKVLASAEKYVQQGKLQNAISEYEKVLKEDPKDLTVLNTVGDICARVGHMEQAAGYFKKVGDTYAAEGFTVKAIAMYKKLTKITPGVTDSIIRLAELYTVQGLYNDARAQYVQVAETYIKAGNNEGAAKTLQKILELDPENTAMQGKLADLYLKIGKRDEARTIFFTAAQSLYAKQAMDAADEALGRVLSIDPKNVDALLLRGTIAAESGDGLRANEYLKKITDIDKRPDALRSLLRAELLVWSMEEAEPLAIKLLTVHNDVNGILWYAEALLNSGKYEEGIRFYEKFADRVLPAHGAALTKSLNAIVAKVKDNAGALEGLRNLFQRAGDSTHDNELIELLAHAYVLENKLAKARDLYKILSEIEPENPLHAQNVKQVIARLGEDAAAAPLSSEQAQQAVMMDELDHEHHVPVIDMQYPADVQAAVRNALTDSELFDSYNLPLKAVPPLETGLAKAPRDPQINARLASLYAKLRRFSDAARAALVVRDIYAEHGFKDDAQKYAELAQQYEQQSSAPATITPPMMAEEPGFTAADFGFADDGSMPPPPAADASTASGGFLASSVANVAVPEPAGQQDAGAWRMDDGAAPAVSAEFGMASEAAVEPAISAPPPVAEFGMASAEEFAPPAVEEVPAPPPVEEFEAAPVAAEHHDEWESMLHVEETPAPPAAPIAAVPEPTPAVDVAAIAEEAGFYIAQSMWTEAEAALRSLASAAPDSPRLSELRAKLESAQAAAQVQAAPAAIPEQIPPAEPQPSVAEFTFATEEAPAAVAAPAPIPPPATIPKPTPLPVAPPPVAAPAMAAASEDVLGDLVADLEDVLGDLGAPEPPKAPKMAAQAAPAAMASAVAKAAPAPTPAPPAAVSTAPVAEPIAEVATVEHHEATSILSDLFDEFKEDVEETAGEVEDPNTHYSLGVAFREMGLLDEAIGELQKVCHAIEKGAAFDQHVQAYTWLAQCLIDKGAPEAAIRWYEKALKVPGLNEESRLAVFYDMGNAYETAGDRKNAYLKFMDVYSSNIDYRDVAERVKALK